MSDTDLFDKVRSPAVEFIDDVRSLAAVVDEIAERSEMLSAPSLFLNIEGSDIGRHGSLSFLTLLLVPTEKIVMIDMHLLGLAVFTTAGRFRHRDTTLGTILGNPSIIKGLFGISSISNALYFQHRIELQGIVDVQIMEVAVRSPVYSKKLLHNLHRCIIDDGIASCDDKKDFEALDEAVLALRLPEYGGGEEILEERPLNQALSLYHTLSVKYLQQLYQKYSKQLSRQAIWRLKVEAATDDKLKASRSGFFEPLAKDNALGPFTNTLSQEEIDKHNDDVLEDYGTGMNARS